MKKRVLSLVLVAVMLLTLVPFSAFAIGGTTITKQPVDAYVNIGDTAKFTIDATNSNTSSLEFVWLDASKIDVEDISVNESLSSLLEAKAGEGKTFTVINVTEDMDGHSYVCAVFYKKLLIPRDLIISNQVTIHVNKEECKFHVLGENLELVEAKAATCAEQGNVKYYHCNVCNRYYLDEECTMCVSLADCMTEKTSDHVLSCVEAAPGTCCEKGNVEYWECDVCGQLFADAEGTQTTNALAVLTEKDMANHTNLVEYPAVASTCSKQGNIHYWYCDGCKDYYSDAEGKTEISKAKIDIDRDPENHAALEEHSAVSASCKAPGNIHYWYCPDCKDYFSDAQGKNEISYSKTVIKQLEHENAWEAVVDSGVEYHVYKCAMCGTVSDTGSHEGGEADCCHKAVCSVCGAEYGKVNPDNHKNVNVIQVIKEATATEDGERVIFCYDCQQTIRETYKLKDVCEHQIVFVEEIPAKCEASEDAWGVKAHYECTVCGTCFEDENGETEITDTDTLTIEPYSHTIALPGGSQVINPSVALNSWGWNDAVHWSACKYCGFDYGKIQNFGNHTMNTSAELTCCSGHKCLICGYDDGQRDLNNHVGDTEVRGAYEPVGDEYGYTGDVYCMGCGEKLEEGRYYKDRCGECENHLVHHDAKPAACTEDGNIEYWECSECRCRFSDAEAKNEVSDIVVKSLGHDIHPGLDTLASTNYYQILSDMGWTTTDLLNLLKEGKIPDVKNISAEDFLKVVSLKDIDHCDSPTEHWLGCQRCGMTLSDIRSDLVANGIIISEKWYELSEKQAHSGGHATCESGPLCENCGCEYGEPCDHEYTIDVTMPTCTEKGYTTKTCKTCSEVIKGDEIPALGHKFNGKATCERCGTRVTNPFVDVNNKDMFYTAVMWAYTYEPQITAGHYTDIHGQTFFDPYSACTRAQVVTFLWRAAGRPDSNGNIWKFLDAYDIAAPYRDAVAWAVEQGITTGYQDGTFKPNQTVNRAEFVTFLWRFFGKPASSGDINVFKDSASIAAPFQPAVAWAVEKGITAGYEDGTFRPKTDCSRWQVVMFMYRAIGEGKASA